MATLAAGCRLPAADCGLRTADCDRVRSLGWRLMTSTSCAESYMCVGRSSCWEAVRSSPFPRTGRCAACRCRRRSPSSWPRTCKAWPAMAVELPWEDVTGDARSVDLLLSTRETTALQRNYVREGLEAGAAHRRPPADPRERHARTAALLRQRAARRWRSRYAPLPSTWSTPTRGSRCVSIHIRCRRPRSGPNEPSTRFSEEQCWSTARRGVHRMCTTGPRRPCFRRLERRLASVAVTM